MTPHEIIARIAASGHKHAVFRVGGKLVAVRHDSASAAKMETMPDADLIGVYNRRAVPEMIAEDARAT